MVEIKCNSCGAVVDTVPIERAGTRLMELASVEICSAHDDEAAVAVRASGDFIGYDKLTAFVLGHIG
jgi:hypothetical protein